jgi:hypothetical protein
VPFLPHGPTCPLHPILLGNLVRYNSPLQISVANWQDFLKFELAGDPAEYNGHFASSILTINYRTENYLSTGTEKIQIYKDL